MISQVSTFIKTKCYLSHDDLHLVALSGGADSVCLLRVLLALGYNVEAMHCNFHLRGDESDRDELFCKELCEKHNVPLHIAHFDTKTYSALHHVSIEMAARDLRYGYFEQLLNDLDAADICVAHHKDDCAETLLMNIIRGTGIMGLTGIRPKNGHIIRPLLCVSRADIENYLTTLNQPYVTDSTNLVDDVTRNKIRLDIMPLLKGINPSVIDALSSTAQHVTEVMPLLDEATIAYEKKAVCPTNDIKTDSDDGLIIDISAIRQSPSPRYLLFVILSKQGFTSPIITQIADHLDSQTGTSWTCGGKRCIIDRGKLVISSLLEEFKDMVLPIEGNYVLADGAKIVITKETVTPNFKIDRSSDVAILDAKTVAFPLCLRRVRQGDRFVPFGMNGSKLVSDFLTDRKLSIVQKEQQLCLTDSTGNILWLVGQRINNKNSVTKDTINVIRVRYIM